MLLLLKMSIRNLLRHRRRSFFTILGMCFGFAILSISISMTNGTYEGLIQMFTSTEVGHLQVLHKEYIDKPNIYKRIKNVSKVISEINSGDSEILISPRLESGGMAYFSEKSVGIRTVAVDINSEEKFLALSKKIKEGNYFSSNSEYSIIISEKIQNILKINIGQDLVIISQSIDGSVANDYFKVIGIISDKKIMGDPMVSYIPLKTGQEFFVMGDSAHRIVVKIKNINKIENYKEVINSKITNELLSVKSWKEVQKEFYKAMETDKNGNIVMSGIIMFMVSMGVLNTILMSVLERTREFGVLKAVGTLPSQIFKLILIEVFILSIIASVMGGFIAFPVNYYLTKVGIKLEHATSVGGIEFSHMKSVLDLESILLPFALITIVSFIVSFIPAIRASKISPVEAMRSN